MPATDPLIYTVIPIHNQYSATRRAVVSLLASSYPNQQICIVDNDSSDESAELLRAEFPTLHYERLSENKGFAAAVNIGIQSARSHDADFVFLCNNDTLVAPDTLTHLATHMHGRMGALSPVIYYLDHPDQIWFAGHLRHPLLLELRPHASGDRHGQLPLDSFQTDYIFGCGMLISMQAIAAIGGFDERYFFYYEDMDFSIRLIEAGFSLWIVPNAAMWHEVSLTAGVDSPFHAFHKARSSVIFFVAYFNSDLPTANKRLRLAMRGLRILAIPCFRLISSLKKSLSFLAGRRIDLLTSHWRGLVAGWRTSRSTPIVRRLDAPQKIEESSKAKKSAGMKPTVAE